MHNYNRMTKCFNDLANGGAQYALNDHQKIQTLCKGLKNDTTIRYHVDGMMFKDQKTLILITIYSHLESYIIL